MNPTGFDEILFRGIPQSRDRGPGSHFTSLLIHVAAVALLLVAAPKLILNNAALRFNTTLIAPGEPPEVVKRVPPPVPAVKVATTTPRELRPLPRPEPRVSLPKLDQAPALPNVPQVKPVLPAQNPVIHPPVQTGLFAANLAPQPEAKLPVGTAREAGFDTVASASPAAPQIVAAAPAGFDVRSAAARPVTSAGAVQTGGFGETATPRAPGSVAGKVSRSGFEASAENVKPTVLTTAIRKTGFDEPQAANAPVKQAAPAVAAVRPIEILDKPKPVYTAEARAQKIEGTVLLDVVFAATGEVRVLGVVRGLGHGLDENAADAAKRIHFTPAKQGGVAVDQRVLLHVVFQITG